MSETDSVEIMLDRMDQATMGRFKEVECDELESMVGQQKKKALVFFGDPNMMKRGEKYFHLTRMVAQDRAANKEDPIEYLYNN